MTGIIFDRSEEVGGLWSTMLRFRDVGGRREFGVNAECFDEVEWDCLHKALRYVRIPGEVLDVGLNRKTHDDLYRKLVYETDWSEFL